MSIAQNTEVAAQLFDTHLRKPCAECVKSAGSYLFDGIAQAKLLPVLRQRNGFVRLHVHPPCLFDDWSAEHAFYFVTITRDYVGQARLEATTAASTFDAALDELKKLP